MPGGTRTAYCSVSGTGDQWRAAAWSGRVRASGIRVRHVRIIRDYGMRDRREAPQYFPAVS